MASSLARSLLLALSPALLLACGGNVIAPGEGGAGAGGQPAAGAGGEGATSGTGTTGSTTTKKQCGGKQGLSCDAGEWCSYDEGDGCGCCDALGKCLPKPEGCPADCPGVCGCDGKFYCNECLAQVAGVNLHPIQECGLPDPDGEYSAVMLPTNAPRFVVFKPDPVEDRCFRLLVEGFDQGPYDIQAPAGWSVGLAEVTNHASDCALDANGWPIVTMQSTEAAAATGTVEFDATPLPCTVDLHATLKFDSASPWAPESESMDVDGLEVEGACP